MSTDEILEEIASRGLSLVLVDGRPTLRGDRTKVTPNLLAVLRWHREKIVQRLAASAPREWLWRTGHRYREEADDRHPAEWNPVGANWWRRQGESGWRLVEGLIDVVVWIDPGSLRAGRGLPPAEHLEGTVPGARGSQSQPVALARA